MKRSKAQIKQLSLLKAMRRYKALGFAYKMAPMINLMLKDGLSQRAIAKKLTIEKVQTASEWIPHKRGASASSNNSWTQTQVCRLIEDIKAVKAKMEWFYTHAHKYNINKFYGVHDPSAHRYTGKYYKLVKHPRKSALEYYQQEMNTFRLNQLYKAGETDGMNVKDIQEAYRRFTKRRSYHKAKRVLNVVSNKAK